MQVGIDKESAAIYQEEIARIKNQIQSDNRKIQELQQLISVRNSKLLNITKEAAKAGVGAAAG